MTETFDVDCPGCGDTTRAITTDTKSVGIHCSCGVTASVDVDDLQLRYSELNVEWRRRHGEDMPKNEEYYPAVVRSALGESTIEEELGLDE